MKRLIGALVLGFAVISAPTVIAKNDKVTICHVPPGNPGNAHTITISVNALKAHLGNNSEGLHGGDYRGECKTAQPSPRGSNPPVPSSSPSVTPSVIPSVVPSVTPSNTPEPTPEPTPTASPEPTGTPEPTVTPEPSTTPSETPRITLPPTDTE